MGNAMQVFQNEEFGQVRIIQEDDKYLFCTKDVATALGYKDTVNAIKAHCRWVVKRHPPHPQSPKRKIEMAFISEGDVYRLIAHSKLPAAERFESWVFDDVLPTIRKHGAYMTDALLAQASKNADIIARVTQALYAERNANKRLADQLQLAEIKVALMRPKVKYYDALVNHSDSFGVRQVAKMLDVSQSQFTSFLLRKKYAYRDADGNLQPYAKALQNGLLIVREYIGRNGHRGTRMLVTLKGRAVFLNEKEEITG